MRIAFRDGYKYQLAETYQVQTGITVALGTGNQWVDLDESGLLTIQAGYAWDGATSAPDWDCALRPSCVHDAIYQLIGCGLIGVEHRETADALFAQMCREDGMTGWMVAIWYRAVRRFGPKGGSVAKPVKWAPC